MLIKTEATESVKIAFEGMKRLTYEVWINPAFVSYVLPRMRELQMAGDGSKLTLTKDGFERFVKAYEQMEGL